MFPELLVQDCLLALKVCLVVSIVYDSFAMRAVWTVLFFVVAVALRPECFARLRSTPKKEMLALVCVSSILSRLQIALKNIKVPSMVIHGP